MNLTGLEVMSDRPMDPSEQEFKRLQFNVEEVEAEHGDQIVDEAREVDFVSLVHILARHIVIREEVDTQRSLEQG